MPNPELPDLVMFDDEASGRRWRNGVCGSFVYGLDGGSARHALRGVPA